jgi:hypothetical protein
MPDFLVSVAFLQFCEKRRNVLLARNRRVPQIIWVDIVVATVFARLNRHLRIVFHKIGSVDKPFPLVGVISASFFFDDLVRVLDEVGG